MIAAAGLALILLTPPGPAHEIHVSYGRVTVDATSITIRLRMFKDDLSKALARHAHRDTVDLGARPLADSLATGYLREKLLVSADGKPLLGRVTSSGSEDNMWWYVIHYPVAAPAKLTLASRVLFELFEDQQNLLKVVPAGGDETSLYFVPGEPGPVEVTIRDPKAPTRRPN